MSKVTAFAILLLLSGSSFSLAWAGEFYGGFLWGAVADYSSTDPLYGTPAAFGLRVGFDIGVQGKTAFAMECDGITTITDGGVSAGSYRYYYDSYYESPELTSAERDAIAEQWSWGLSSVALYLAARPGAAGEKPAYFKAKAGLICETLTVDTAVQDANTSTAFSFGIGVGANLGHALRMEIELVTVDENLAHVEAAAAYAF